jgi:hypothetical protein
VPDILVAGSGGDAISASVMGFLREFQRRQPGVPPRP